MLLRTRGEWGCVPAGCRQLVQRFVWDGDQLLYEISAPGATGESATNMERDVNQPLQFTGFALTGRVTYTHGLGLDAPLAVIRMEHSSNFPNPFVITPYTTWRGDYDAGSGVPCTQVWQPGPGPGDSTLVEVCASIDWPAPYLWISKLARSRAIGPTTWIGSLIEGQRDMSGLMYRRNRYYDPSSGRFTQEDPVGLAGGFNLYGFAGGDPVTNGDPFGLACERHGSDRLTCTGAPGDWLTISQFLGGAMGWNVFRVAARAGLTKWSPATCRGGFSYDACSRIAGGLATLIVHESEQCNRLGTSATKRFESGRFDYSPGRIKGGIAFALNAGLWVEIPVFGRKNMIISQEALDEYNLANVIAHEEYHFDQRKGGGPLHGILQNDEFYQMGDLCGGARKR